MSKTLAMIAVLLFLAIGCACQSDVRPEIDQAKPTVTDGDGKNIPKRPVPMIDRERSVTIDAPDGVKLAGTFFEAEKPDSPGVLLLHQWQSNRHAFDEFVKRLGDDGFNVLSIDGRGFGESVKNADGRAIKPERTDDAVASMLGDVGAAYDFLAKQRNVDAERIAIVGASYGSSLAIIYAAGNSKVAAVALLSPGLNYFGNMPIEPAVKSFGSRPLYMFAADDDKASADAVRKLIPANAGRAAQQQTIYPKGGHGTALLKVGAADELTSFLSASLQMKK